MPPKLFGTGQPKIIEMSQTINDQTPSSIWKPSSPAIILPINAFGQTLTPSIDSEAYPTNVSASMGRTAYLKCRIKNLGHKSVRKDLALHFYNISIQRHHKVVYYLSTFLCAVL